MTVTAVDLPGIIARGKGTVLFVPAIANIMAPKLTELNAASALNLSCLLYGFAPGVDQASVAKVRYCYETEVEQPGVAKYTIPDITYDYDPQAITSADPYKHYAAMAPGTLGYLVDRRGFGKDQALAVGQIVDVYPVILGVRKREAIDPTAEGETLRVTQKVFVRADPALDVALVA